MSDPTTTIPAAETVTHDGHTVRFPFANLLPALPPDEFTELRNDIAANGIQVAIMFHRILIEDTTVYDVLDGQHRFRAAIELGMSWDDIPKDIRDNLAPQYAAELAFNLNAKRRQLTSDQRAAAAVKLRQAGLSYRKIAAALGTSPETARQAVLAAGPDAQPEQITGADGKTYDAVTLETRILDYLSLQVNRKEFFGRLMQDLDVPSGTLKRTLEALAADDKIIYSGVYWCLPPHQHDIDTVLAALEDGPADFHTLCHRTKDTVDPSVLGSVLAWLRQHHQIEKPAGDVRYTLTTGPETADNRFDKDKITIWGRSDDGAWHRAIEVGRSLAASGIWNGTDHIEFDAYLLHDKLYGVAKIDPFDLEPGNHYSFVHSSKAGRVSSGYPPFVLKILDGLREAEEPCFLFQVKKWEGISGDEAKNGIALLVAHGKVQRVSPEYKGQNNRYKLVNTSPETADQPDDPPTPDDDYKMVRAAIRHALFHNADRDYFTVADITERTEYNAFAVASLCADLVERGTLIEHPQGWQPAPHATIEGAVNAEAVSGSHHRGQGTIISWAEENAGEPDPVAAIMDGEPVTASQAQALADGDQPPTGDEIKARILEQLANGRRLHYDALRAGSLDKSITQIAFNNALRELRRAHQVHKTHDNFYSRTTPAEFAMTETIVACSNIVSEVKAATAHPQHLADLTAEQRRKLQIAADNARASAQALIEFIDGLQSELQSVAVAH